MAIQIISPNLNTYGNNGNFETDPSTWGFGYYVQRSNAESYLGSFSCKKTIKQDAGPPIIRDLITIINDKTSLIQANFSPVAGKSYIFRVKCKVPSSTPPANDAMVIAIQNGSHESASVTIGDIKGLGWVELELITEAGDIHTSDTYILLKGDYLTDQTIEGGIVYFDQFEIYEYIEVDDEPVVCDLVISSIDITNESAPAAGDGIITVNTTGGTGTLEYSKNNGASWQLSDTFTGLGADVYFIKVREQITHACEAMQAVVVNHGALDFDFTVAVTNETVAGSEDGEIAITPTGAGSPWTYSKDGGVSFQSGNVFSNLAPGTYYLVVKSTTGILKLAIATVEIGSQLFSKIYFSKNPIEYQRAAQVGYEALTNYRLYNEVRVEDVADSSSFITKLKSELEPTNGLAKFKLRQAFRGVLSAVPPSQNTSTINRLTDRIKFYKNYSGHLQDDEVTPSVLTASNPFLVMLGGIDKLRFPTINYFTSYISTNKKFLTWAPLEKEVQRLQEDYLNFWVYALATTSLKLIIKAYYDDGTDETSTISTTAGVKYGQLYQIPAGPANSGVAAINPAKNLIKYELWLTDQADSLISEVRTYRLAPFTHPLTRYFMFLNSLGSYEVMYFKGQAEITSRIQRDIIQKHLPSDYSALQGEFETNNPTIRDEASHSSGFFKGKYAAQWQEYMKDLLLSNRVYELKGQTRKPVTIKTDSFKWKQDQDYSHFVQFEIVEAYENESFTPADV